MKRQIKRRYVLFPLKNRVPCWVPIFGRIAIYRTNRPSEPMPKVNPCHEFDGGLAHDFPLSETVVLRNT